MALPGEITAAKVRKRNVKPARRPPPAIKPTRGVFGPLGRADRSIVHAQRQAHQRVQRAQRRLPERPLPSIPTIRRPTRRQNQAAISLTRRSTRNLTPAQKRDLSQDPRSRAKLRPAQRAVRSQQRALNLSTGRASQPRPAYGPPTPLAPFTQVDALKRSAVVRPRYLPTGRDALRQQGSRVSTGLRSEIRPYDTRTRVGLPGATVDITGLHHALAPYASRSVGIPAAIVKGGAPLVSSFLNMESRPFSDKGVVGRSINDLLTFPSAAVPTLYQLATHPGKMASGIADQITHPGETFSQHPLFGALLVHGGVSALGRTSGAVARSGVFGQGVKQAAGTSRPMVGLAGESGATLRTPRRYSKDVFRKGAQVLYDRRLKPIRDRHGNVVKDAQGRPVMAAPERSRIYSSKGLQKKRADFVASRANAVERNARVVASRIAMAAQPVREHRGVTLGTFPSRAPIPHALRGRTVDTAAIGRAIDRSAAAQPLGPVRVLHRAFYRPEKDVVAMAMEGTLRSPKTFKADLLKERQRLEDVYQKAKSGDVEMDPLQKRTNRMRARTIDRVLKTPKALANAEAVFRSAKTLAAHGNELARKSVEQGLLDPAAARRAKLFPYAQSHMGAKVVDHNDGSQSLRASDGTFLSNDQIHAHMQDPGTGPVVNPADIAYLPHRTDVRGARAYHQQFRLQRPNLDQQSRTGAAYEKGATDTSYSNPLEHIVRATTTLARAHEFDKLIGDVAVKHPSGRYFTWKEAQAWAARGGRDPSEATNRLIPGEPELVPVRALPAKYDDIRSQAIQNEQGASVPGASERLVREQTSRFDGPDPLDPNAQNVVLVPKVIADRLQENLKPSHSFDKAFQAATSAFRTTVLPFSTKWLTGNVVEAVLRSGIAGVSPHDPLVGRKLVREMTKQDPEGAAQILSHLVSGLLYGEKGLTNRRTAEDVAGPTGGMVARSLPGRAVGKTIKGVTDPIFAFNRGLERETQYAALGKFARQQMQEMTGSWFKALRAQDQALADLAKGLKNTHAQQDAARFIDETLGKYSRFSPGMRRLIQGYAPFLPWYLNSIRFVMHTLPVRHPVKTAVLTQAEAAFQQDWEEQYKSLTPKQRRSFKTAIPSKGGFVDLARYTPFGFPGPLAAGDFGPLSGIILPQTQGIQMGLALGQDPFGNPLKVPKTPGNPTGEASPVDQLLYGANQALEAYAPGLGLTRRLREGGRKSLATSTVLSPQTSEPGPGQPKVSAPNRVFNPFRPVYVSPGRESSPAKQFQSKYGVKGSKLDKASFQKKYGVKSAGMSKEEFQAKYGVGK